MQITKKVKQWGKTGLYVGLSKKKFKLGQEVIISDEPLIGVGTEDKCKYDPTEIRDIIKEEIEKLITHGR